VRHNVGIYSLHQGPARGFFSNLTTLLTCSRFLVEQKGVDLSNIFMHSDMFSLYGDPRLWFDSSIINDNGTSVNSLIGFNLSQHPTAPQLDLNKYLQRFTWNNRVQTLLNTSVTMVPNTVGIHYRGTDHNINDNLHGLRVSPDKVLEIFYKLYDQHQVSGVFICSDEQDSLDYLRNNIINHCNIDPYVNPATRLVNSSQGLHWQTTLIDKVKIADEVIVDAWCLSQCSVIIGKTSNLINFARILNPDVKVYYADLD
jgi:hypothetical protein